MEDKRMKNRHNKTDSEQIAKATLRVGVYRITAHPDFGRRKTAPKLI